MSEEPTPPIDAAKGYLQRARTWFTELSRPARMLLVSTVSIALLLGGYVTFVSSRENYVPLFTSLDRDDAAGVVAKLKEQKIPFRIIADGTTVEVPEARVHELRLEMASAGLPRGGGVGFESFDKIRLGATEFEQRVLYRRALEGELSRTIGSIAAVKDARVHLVLPDKSVFITKNEPASASVVVRLRPGRALGPSEVNGIIHLVASSVQSLSPDGVTLVTTEGQVLHRARNNNGASGVAGANGEAVNDEDRSMGRSLEATLEERVRGLLEKTLGPGHVDVRVTADVDTSRVERVEDRFDSAHSALRSEEQSIERGTGPNEMTATGIPGAESNLPSGAASGAGVTPAPSASGNLRESHTRNYEVGRVTEKRVTTGGTVKRLAVAVVVDHLVTLENGQNKRTPRSQEELDKITALVKSAVGANAERGDVVTVESVPFLDNQPLSDLNIEAPEKGLNALPRNVKIAIGGVAGLLVLLAAAAVLRRSKSSQPSVVTVESPALAASSASSGASLGELSLPESAQLSPSLAAYTGGERGPREAAKLHAAADPATAALIIRSWLGTLDNREEAEKT